MRAQILATEHWSLLATRSLAWSEAYSRAGIFLTVLSAAVVALALVAQATGTQRTFTMFALLLLPVVLFLGLATYVRLGAINDEDARLVLGMNRLRHGYLDIAPDLEPYFITGHHDDMPGLAQTLAVGLDGNLRRRFPLQVLVSTPVVVGVIDCVVAGVLGGLVGRMLGLSTTWAVALGVLAALLLLVLLVVLPVRHVTRWTRVYTPRFPR